MAQTKRFGQESAFSGTSDRKFMMESFSLKTDI
jgi:hypothetical protein